LSTQTYHHIINVIFLFFSAHSSLICNFIDDIHSHCMLPENMLTSNYAIGFCFLSEGGSRQI